MEPDLIVIHKQEEISSEKVILLPVNDQIRELQTVIRDKSTTRSDFKFYADRLIRLIVEHGLNQLPFKERIVVTPTGHQYDGNEYAKGNCGVSIMRSGEAMEEGLRDCCRSIRIGKILIQTDEETHDAKLFYAKLPPDIKTRKVLLLYPIMNTGNTVLKALKVLKEHGVQETNIIFLNLFTTPKALETVSMQFSDVTIVTSEIHQSTPNHFGTKYFGTE